MCAILDAGTVAEVFGEERNAPGRQFFEWLETPHARLIVGGRNPSLTSNDPHVIALADVSGARILYSNDENLRDDFRNSVLVSSPRGKLYPTGESAKAERRRRRLLNATDLCPNRG